MVMVSDSYLTEEYTESTDGSWVTEPWPMVHSDVNIT